jgi:GntR family transcriptional regulator
MILNLLELLKEVKEHNVPMALTLRDMHDQVVPKVPLNADQVARDLTDRIAAGEYGEPGSQLPTYAALAALYSVSESTVTKVIGLLRERGVVIGVPGRGTFVAEK